MCGFVYLNAQGISEESFEASLEKLHHRGPDDTEMARTMKGWLGFKRLAIMDLSHSGDQPFFDKSHYFACNGEIYNYKKIKEKYADYSFQSESDCEVLLPPPRNRVAVIIPGGALIHP